MQRVPRRRRSAASRPRTNRTMPHCPLRWNDGGSASTTGSTGEDLRFLGGELLFGEHSLGLEFAQGLQLLEGVCGAGSRPLSGDVLLRFRIGGLRSGVRLRVLGTPFPGLATLDA